MSLFEDAAKVRPDLVCDALQKNGRCKMQLDTLYPSNTDVAENATTQEAKADAGKPRLTLVPTEIVYQIEKVRSYGNRKYPNGGPDNWKKVEAQRYWEACIRHIVAAWNDYKAVDPESGLPHISHAACNLAFWMELIKEGA